MSKRLPLVSVALISAALLAYEICLMQLFAVIHFHHFAYMVISLALLGYGASGSFLAVGECWLRRHHDLVYPLALALFGLTAPLAFALGQAVPFNGLELFWDGRQSLYLALLFLLFMVPFFFGALAIALALLIHRRAVGRVYGYDLVGAGVGCLAVLGLLWLLPPVQLLVVIAALGLVAAGVSLFEIRLRYRRLVGVVLAMAVAALPTLAERLPLEPSPYKPLQQALQVSGARIEKELSSPFGVLTVVDSPLVPFRHAPGMSLTAGREPLPQKAVFTNGDGLTAITRAAREREQLGYLDQMTSALPYHLQEVEKALILGLGGGQDVLQARYHGIADITAVELNPQMVRLLRDDYGAYGGDLLAGGVSVQIRDLRDYLRHSHRSFDLIQLALVDSFLPAAAGLYALRENYLYTVEALEEYVDRLSPRGMVAITRWLKNPPRDSLKLVATAIEALQRRDVSEVGDHLVLIRGWQTATLIVTREKFSHEQGWRLVAFCQERAFDIVFGPGIGEDWANRYNILAEPTLALGVRALLRGEGESFFAGYKYHLQPATDDRPYFHHFFKWASLPELLRLRQSGGAALMESGYLILVTVMLVATLGAVLLVLAPLLLLRREGQWQRPSLGMAKFLYFLATGLGFMMIEIACIQKVMRYLHHPVYAVSVVIAAFLVFAGLGSMATGRLSERGWRPRTVVRLAVIVIALGGLLFMALGRGALAALPELALPGRMALTVLAIAPMALFMGMPFPLGLASLPNGVAPAWAWGINGCASVLGSMIATLVAIDFGFNAVLAAAVVLYLVVAASFPETEIGVSSGKRPHLSG